MKSLLESLNIALFESKTVKSTVKDFFNWYFDEDCDDLVKDRDLGPRCADILHQVDTNTTKKWDQDDLGSFIQSNFDEPISVKFDEGRGAYTAQFSIGTVKFDLDCMNVSLKPSR